MGGYRRLSPVVLAVLATGSAIHAQPGPAKIAVINGHAALVNTQQGKKAFDQLKTKVDSKKKEFESRQNELTTLEDQFNKSASVMAEDKREQLAGSINDKKKRLQRDLQDADEETQREQKEAFQPLEGRLNTVINQYAADNGYAVVIDVSVEGNQVRYAAPTVDITRDVVALYDKTFGNKP